MTKQQKLDKQQKLRTEFYNLVCYHKGEEEANIELEEFDCDIELEHFGEIEKFTILLGNDEVRELKKKIKDIKKDIKS